MKIVIIGAGMMGSALGFPAKENGNEVHIVGTHLDKDIINGLHTYTYTYSYTYTFSLIITNHVQYVKRMKEN